MCPPWLARAASRRPPSDRDTVDNLKAADWNLDGVITADEFGGKTRALAMRADVAQRLGMNRIKAELVITYG